MPQTIKQIREPRKKKAPPWDKSAERLLLFLDIMGFKARIYEKSHKLLEKELRGFQEKWTKATSQFTINDQIKYVQFSDTILVAANGTDEAMFNRLTKTACRIMHTALSKGFPIKGIIAQGELLFDKEHELYFGRPLVDAALLYDELHFYGVVVHHTAERTIKQYQDRQNPYPHSLVPIKGGKTRHYHLAWNLLGLSLDVADITATCNGWLDKIAEQVSGKPRIYIDNTRDVLQKDALTYGKAGADSGETIPG